MKVKLHIPTEQYGFVEVHAEVETVGDAVALYNVSTREELTSGEGLPHLDWIYALDGYMATHTLSSSAYENMNKEQQGVIQELKRHYKRLKAKE